MKYIYTGSAHYYQNSEGWSRQMKLVPNGDGGSYNFGSSVDLLDNSIMIGAIGDKLNTIAIGKSRSAATLTYCNNSANYEISRIRFYLSKCIHHL
jgi:hypothetical protein